MLKLAAIIQNPGEPPVESRYTHPAELKELGYNGQVLYATTALSGVEKPEAMGDSEMRRWVTHHIDHVQQKIEQAREAGLMVFISYDALVLPTDVVSRYEQQLCCRKRPGTLCPASDQAVELSVQALAATLNRWPQIDGVVLRFGDNDAARLPYLVGNDIYSPHCPRCAKLGRADRILKLVHQFYEQVVEKMDKRLIIRAWNLRPGGLHDSPQLAERVVAQLPGKETDDRLMLSFKFTQTDFWRYQHWNRASLKCGKRPVIYELQCQREFEGKGAVPNYQLPLWRDGQPEAADEEYPAGLAKVSEQVNIGGLWAWVRGGGWGGPFIKHEDWIDANVYAVPLLADNLKIDPADAASQWINERLNVRDRKVVRPLAQILQDSPQFARDMFYIGPFARLQSSDWHPNGDWIQDDVINVEAAWRIVQRVPEAQLEQVVSEKSHAADQISADRAAFQHVVKDRNHRQMEPLLDAMVYAESLVEMLRELMAGLVAYRLWQKSHSASDATLSRQKLLAAQSHWNHHTQRHGSLRGAATPFREQGFWDVTQRLLSDLS